MTATPPRHGSGYTPMTTEQQQTAAREREAGRLGHVAHHQGQTAEACPYADGDPLRQLWLDGLSAAQSRRLRLDMTPARAKGDAAFRDGLRLDECPLPFLSPERTDWIAAYEAARIRHETDEAERYR